MYTQLFNSNIKQYFLQRELKENRSNRICFMSIVLNITELFM